MGKMNGEHVRRSRSIFDIAMEKLYVKKNKRGKGYGQNKPKWHNQDRKTED